MYFLPPLGIEDRAKFSIDFVLGKSVMFSLQADTLIHYIAKIFKKLQEKF